MALPILSTFWCELRAYAHLIHRAQLVGCLATEFLALVLCNKRMSLFVEFGPTIDKIAGNPTLNNNPGGCDIRQLVNISLIFLPGNIVKTFRPIETQGFTPKRIDLVGLEVD